MVVRIGPAFGPVDGPGSLEDNVLATPVYLPAVAEAVLDLLLDQLTGLLHLTHGEACTGVGWKLRRRALEERVHAADPPPVAEASRALASERIHVLPGLDTALQAWRAEASAIRGALAG
jgi:hypothetical protein